VEDAGALFASLWTSTCDRRKIASSTAINNSVSFCSSGSIRAKRLGIKLYSVKKKKWTYIPATFPLAANLIARLSVDPNAAKSGTPV
jgi:hypothetical protein